MKIRSEKSLLWLAKIDTSRARDKLNTHTQDNCYRLPLLEYVAIRYGRMAEPIKRPAQV